MSERLKYLIAILASVTLWWWTGRVAAGVMMFGVATILVVFDKITGFTKEEA